MKVFILMAALATGAFFFARKQRDISGTWLLETKANKCEAAGYYTAKLDILEQEVYDRAVSLQVASDSIKIWLDATKTRFIKVAVNDSVFTGQSWVENKIEPVKFCRVNN